MSHSEEQTLRLYYSRMDVIVAICGLGVILIVISQVAFRLAPVSYLSEGVGTAAGLWGGVTIIVGGLVWLATRSKAVAAHAVEAGDYTIRWRYDEAEWNDFLAQQKKPDALLPLILAPELGRLDESIVAYEGSATLNPDEYDTQFELGELLLLAGRPAEAEPRFIAAANAHDWNPRAGFVAENEARALLGVMVAKCVIGRNDEVLADIVASETQILDWYWTTNLKRWGYITQQEVAPGEVRSNDEIIERAQKAWVADGCPGPFDLPESQKMQDRE